eukprot:COSAG06_NODE_7330_length_2543_cov_126.607494_1_plen_60_part_00
MEVAKGRTADAAAAAHDRHLPVRLAAQQQRRRLRCHTQRTHTHAASQPLTVFRLPAVFC